MPIASDAPAPIAWHAHPDARLEALLATASPPVLEQALDSPGVQADPYARLRVLDALYRRDRGREQVEWQWLQAMLMANRPSPAWEVVRQWPMSDTTGFQRLFLAAQVAQIAASREDARARYAMLVETFPSHVDGLQKALEFDPGMTLETEVRARLEAWADGAGSAYEQEKALFAMASHLRRGAPSEAFASVLRAQQLKSRRVGPWDAAGTGARIAADRNARAAPVPVRRGVRPLFVVGLPRSGTTLVSAMLAAHPRVANAGEQGLVAALAMGPARAMVLAGGAHSGVFQAWYQAALGDLAAGADVVVDKMPLNAEHVGVILAAFPDAVVVHIERALPDVAASIHLHDFDFGCLFSLAGEDIARYARTISDHLAHWRRREPARVLHLSYEALTVDAPAALAPVLDALGLQWDPVMADFWQRPQSVATFSEAQVQRPLNRDAVDAWRRFLPAAAGFMRSIGVEP